MKIYSYWNLKENCSTRQYETGDIKTLKTELVCKRYDFSKIREIDRVWWSGPTMISHVVRLETDLPTDQMTWLNERVTCGTTKNLAHCHGTTRSSEVAITRTWTFPYLLPISFWFFSQALSQTSETRLLSFGHFSM